MTETWPFDQARNVAAVTTRQVVSEGAPILLVVHYSDDDSWAFLNGGPFDQASALVVSMGEVVSMDETLLTVADLPPGWVADRESVDGEWLRRPDDDV